MTQTEQLHTALAKYNEAWSEFASIRQSMFPLKSKVRINCDRYIGIGRVTMEDGCPIDKLPVRLENGNTLWYPIAACEPV